MRKSYGCFFFFLVLIFEILTRELSPRKVKWPARGRPSPLAWGRGGPHPGSSSQEAVGAAPPPRSASGARASGTRPAPASCHLTRNRPPRNLGGSRRPEAPGGALGSWRPGPGEEAACVLATASETRLGAAPPATPPSRRPARPALPGPRGPQPPCRTLPPARAPGKPAPRRQRARPRSPSAAEPPHSQP